MATFRIGELSPDIILFVFERLPSYWHVVSLRLSCRAINAIYIQYHNIIDQAQADRLTRPVLQYYRFLTTLHVDAARLELPSPAWNIKADKTNFATRVLRSLPYLRTQSGEYIYISSNYQSVDWREETWKHDLRGDRESRIAGCVNVRDCVALAWSGILYIDTMHATIHDYIARHERSSPSIRESRWRKTEDVATYFEAQRQALLSMVYIPPFGSSLSTLYPKHGEPWLEQEEHDAVVSIFRKHGWPYDFNKEEASLELDAAFDDMRDRWRWR